MKYCGFGNEDNFDRLLAIAYEQAEIAVADAAIRGASNLPGLTTEEKRRVESLMNDIASTMFNKRKDIEAYLKSLVV